MSTSTLSGRMGGASSERSSTGGDIARQVLVVVAYISTVVVNAIANTITINGVQTGEVSDALDTFFAPASYVFSIWSLIYLGLAAYVVYQALPRERTNPRLRAIGWLFIASSVFNITWLFAWHYFLYPLSVVLMLGILGALIAIYQRLYPAYQRASTAEKVAVHWTFRIYLGWITVATIANVTGALVAAGWQGPPIWAAIMTVVATAIGLFFALGKRDVAYTLVLVWAFVGLWVKYDEPIISITAIAAAALLAVAIVVTIVRSTRSRNRPRTAGI